MKISKNHIQTIVFIGVYLFAIYLWTLPFQTNTIPYGEFDAISHWELGDFISQRDRTFIYLPPFLDFSYGNDNEFIEHTLWYHPPFHTDLAIISSFSQDRVIPIFFTNAIFATSILISIYFVIRKLFGFLPGILSAFLLTFSLRDINPYLWGQWPERFAYAFIPLILYCFYMYYVNYSENRKPLYLYLMSFLLSVNLMIHPLVFFHSLVGLVFLWVGLIIKNKKINFNFKHLSIAALIFLILFAIFPYQSGNVVMSFTKSGNPSENGPSFSRLFQWAPNPEDFRGSVPDSYFSYNAMHGLWTLPFLLLGILLLLIRAITVKRDNASVFLLAWLVSLYFILHRDLIGKMIFLHRSLSASAHIFIPITVLGGLLIPSFIPMKKNYKNYMKYGIAILIIGLALIFNMPIAFDSLSTAYDSPIIRLNQDQIEVSEWIRDNTDENQNVSIIGPPDQIMQKVWWMASFSHRTSYFFEGFLTWKTYKDNREETIRTHLLDDYIVVDYSDIALFQDRSLIEGWQKFESENLVNHAVVYEVGNIKVYKYES